MLVFKYHYGSLWEVVYSCLPVKRTRLQRNSRSNVIFLILYWAQIVIQHKKCENENKKHNISVETSTFFRRKESEDEKIESRWGREKREMKKMRNGTKESLGGPSIFDPFDPCHRTWSKHSYKRVCPSVRPSARPSARPSTCPLVFRQIRRKSLKIPYNPL